MTKENGSLTNQRAVTKKKKKKKKIYYRLQITTLDRIASISRNRLCETARLRPTLHWASNQATDATNCIINFFLAAKCFIKLGDNNNNNDRKEGRKCVVELGIQLGF